MYRYYQTSIKEINGVTIPDEEPDNWLGYRNKDKYYIKSTEMMNEKELDDVKVKECPIETNLLKDQYV